MGSKMGDRVLLVIAEDGDELVAGALNLIGGDTLFGRLWGCHPQVHFPSLHFEACYYQVGSEYLIPAFFSRFGYHAEQKSEVLLEVLAMNFCLSYILCK